MSETVRKAETILLGTVDGNCFEIPVEVFRSYRIEKPEATESLRPTGMVFDVLESTDAEVEGFDLPVDLPTCPVGYRLVVRSAGWHGTKFFCVPSRGVLGIMDAVLGGQ